MCKYIILVRDSLPYSKEIGRAGAHIEILLLTLFLHHLPELIRQGKIYTVVSPVYKVTTAKKEVIYFYTEKEAQKWFRTHKSFSAVHIKGLGELAPDELFETSMDPTKRKLVQLTTDNIEATLDLYNQLMGKQPSLRRDFIIKHKLSSVGDEDAVFDDEEDFGE